MELVYLPNNYKRNTYKSEHTFPGPGAYDIVVEDPNRNYGVKNIPNSVFTVFTIKSTLVINAELGNNTTPVLLNPPIDMAAVHQLFVHNPAAYDAEGDSLSYDLTMCLGEDGNAISGYTLPPASKSLTVNAVTGDLVWDSPTDSGSYNVAINVMEWRNGIKIGNIVRDMQIDVRNTTNHPPVNDPLPALCVEAGKKISLLVTSRDQDNDPLSHKVIGGPLGLATSPAKNLQLISASAGTITSLFTWQTVCQHVRKQPYEVILKEEDNNPHISLVDMDPIIIDVLGPAPKNVTAEPATNAVTLKWESCGCSNIKGYNIYRKVDSSKFVVDSCRTGILNSAGFIKIGFADTTQSNSFIDNNQGAGLTQGELYCYRVAAVFDGDLEGYPSEEVCTPLVPGLPFICNVSVDSDAENGEISLAWRIPTNFDATQFPGPYQYYISRSNDLWGGDFKLINSSLTSITDTTFVDTPINTLAGPYSYMIELFDVSKGMRVGYPGIASTLLPELTPTDQRVGIHFSNNTPWQNNSYDIYRSEEGGAFVPVATSFSKDYDDKNLVNGHSYDYYAISHGTYNYNDIQYSTVNRSLLRNIKPYDNVPPCAPSLSVTVSCDSLFNVLHWALPNGSCGSDIASYILFYSNLVDNPLDSLTTIPHHDVFSFKHFPSLNLGGAYGIVAVDSVGNRSEMIKAIAADSCSLYDLPNVFTPNGDGINDLFVPVKNTYQYVEKVSMKIFNRYGVLVFETEDPKIRWDGKMMNTNKLAAPGVYYYICDVWERRSVGVFLGAPKVGFVYLLADKQHNKTD